MRPPDSKHKAYSIHIINTDRRRTAQMFAKPGNEYIETPSQEVVILPPKLAQNILLARRATFIE